MAIDTKNMMTVFVTLIVGIIIVSGVMAPVIADSVSTSESFENEGAQWVRMAYVTDDTDYSFSVDISDSVSITNGDNTQTGDMIDMILYADSLCSIFVSDGDIILVGANGNYTQMSYLGNSFTVSRSNGVLTVDDGSVLYSPSATVEWAYVPIGTGTYGSFNAGGLQRDQSNLVAVGSFAGVGCYDDKVSLGGLVMDADVTSEYINSVKWILNGGGSDDSEDAFEPATPTSLVAPVASPRTLPIVQGTEPVRGGSENGGGTRAVPTPTYTDGDWGYELDGTDATIISYSGAGGGAITIPATVGGYSVVAVGKGEYEESVFDTNLSATDLIISS